MPRNSFRTTLTRLATALLCLYLVPAAFAQSPVKVEMTITNIRGLGSFEGDAPDFYAVMAIDGRPISTEDWESQDDNEDDRDISPNWHVDGEVDITRGIVPLRIEIMEEDDFARLGDERVDVSPGASHALNLTLDLATCSVSGDTTGSAVFGDRTCRIRLETTGVASSDPTVYAGRLQLQIDVTNLPGDGLPGMGGAFVTCSHDTIWPRPGGTVTFRGETYTSDADGRMPVLADSISVVFDHADLAPRSCAGTSECTEPKMLPVTRTVTYGCEARVGGRTLFSGWRSVRVGFPAAGRAVPLMVGPGGREHSIDIVFVADRGTYSGPDDLLFLSDVFNVIRNDYLSEDAFALNGDRFSFWVALDTGRADGFDSGSCNLDPPSNWDDDYGFADSGAVLHRREDLRDCATRSERMFSALVTDTREGTSTGRIAIHETAHSPFGLADEYCDRRMPPAGTTCDGGYFETEEAPNVYVTEDNCHADMAELQFWDARLGDPIRVTCFLMPLPDVLTPWGVERGARYFTSEPVRDLMVRSADPPRGADIRSFEHMFKKCGNGRCR